MPDNSAIALRQKQRIRRRRFGIVSAGPGTAYGVAIQVAAWYKADSLGLSNGNSLTGWNDSGPGAWNLILGTAPTFSTTNFPSGAVKFVVASVQFLKNTTFNALSSQAGVTTFVVCKPASTAGNKIIWGPTNFATLLQQGVSNGITVYGSSGNSGIFTPDDTSKHVQEIVFDGTQAGNSTRLVAMQDGVQQTLTFTGTIPATTAATVALGVGATNAGAAPFDGDIAEILTYASVLTLAQRSAIRVALGAKWGVTVTP